MILLPYKIMPKRKTKSIIQIPFDVITENIKTIENASDTQKHLDTIHIVKDSIQDMKNKYDDLVENFKSVDKQRLELENQLLKSIKDVEKWKEKVHIEQTKQESMAKEIEIKDKRINEILDERNKLLNEFKLEKESLEKQIQNYVIQVKDLSGTIGNFFNQLNIKDKEIISLNNIVDKKKSLIQQVKNELDLVQSQFQGMKKEYTIIKTEYEHMMSESNLLEEKVNQLTHELRDKTQLVKELNGQMANLQILLKKYKSKCVIL